MEPTFKTHDVDWAEPLHQDYVGRPDLPVKVLGGQLDSDGRYLCFDAVLVNQAHEPIALGVRPKKVFVDAVNLAFHQLRTKPICYHLWGQSLSEVEPEWGAVQFLAANLLEFKDQTEEPLQREFQRHARNWSAETAHLSSETQIVLHPSYQRIIGMGPAALTFIFRDLQAEPKDWFWALNAITGEDPVDPSDAGNVSKIVDSWLRWGREHGYI
jgi:hypothetical protein